MTGQYFQRTSPVCWNYEATEVFCPSMLLKLFGKPLYLCLNLGTSISHLVCKRLSRRVIRGVEKCNYRFVCPCIPGCHSLCAIVFLRVIYFFPPISLKFQCALNLIVFKDWGGRVCPVTAVFLTFDLLFSMMIDKLGPSIGVCLWHSKLNFSCCSGIGA